MCGQHVNHTLRGAARTISLVIQGELMGPEVRTKLEVRNAGCWEESACSLSGRALTCFCARGELLYSMGAASCFKASVSGWLSRATCGVIMAKGRGP